MTSPGRWSRRRLLATGAAALGPLGGCSAPTGDEESPDIDGRGTDDRTPSGAPGANGTPPGTGDGGPVGYPMLRPDGNRVVAGRGPLPGARPVDVSIGGTPAWLVGVRTAAGSDWVAVDENGVAHGFRLEGGDPTPLRTRPDRLPSGTPPVLVVDDEGPRLLAVPAADASTETRPLPLGVGRLAYVGDGGDLVLRGASELDRLRVDAPPDARPVRDGSGRIAVLADATRRYDHGALGDSIEAVGVALVDVTPAGRLSAAARIRVPGEAVIEGLSPIFADLTGDGTTAVIVTETDAERGARVVAYGRSGARLAAGPPVGTGFRWRHQLAVAPFAPDGGRELAVVRTPHIGGVVEFYRRRGDALEVAATHSGYSSHAFGSRNLDGGFAGDADGDGRVELVVPTQDRTSLAGIRRTTEGAATAWRVPVGGRVATNLAAVSLGGDRFAVAVGRSDGVVRVWT